VTDETDTEMMRRRLSTMSDEAIATMYERIVLGGYVPVTELGEGLWQRLRETYGERNTVRAVAMHCRARLGIEGW